MLRPALIAALFLSLALPAAADPQLPAACPELAKRETLYKVCDDQGAVLASAREEAKRQGKLMLVVLGATWCPSCKVLHKQMEALLAAPLGADKARTVGSAYLPVEIATSTLNGPRREPVPTGTAVLEAIKERAPGVTMRGVPFLAVMDAAEGGRVIARNLDELEGRDGFDMARLAQFLASAERHIRHGEAAPAEPGWLGHKLYRLWRKIGG